MYNPAIHTATNKPIGLTGKPVDARTYFYDAATFTYRAYANPAEVLAYLGATDRVGQFSIIINSGGVNSEWWFKDGVTDGDLVLKGTGGSTTITADVTSGDSQPLIIPHPGMVWPSVFYRNTDGSEYTGAHNTDDGTNIIVTGDADGSGNFADNFKVIIKP